MFKKGVLQYFSKRFYIKKKKLNKKIMKIKYPLQKQIKKERVPF